MWDAGQYLRFGEDSVVGVRLGSGAGALAHY